MTSPNSFINFKKMGMKPLYFLLPSLLLTVFCLGQTTLMLEDFEDATVNYTSSLTEGNDGNENYWIRTSGPDPDVSFSNVQGSSYFAAMNYNALPSGTDVETLTFSGIDISGYSSLTFSGFFAEDDDGTNQDWDGDSQVSVAYRIDGVGGFTTIFAIEAAGGLNTEPRVDTNLDGTGDGTAITDAFQEFSAAIAGTGSTLELVITVSNLDAGDEDIAFDDIKVSGDFVPATTVVQFASDAYSLAEDGLFVDVCVSISNPDAMNATTVEMNVDGAISTATNGTDYDDGAGTPMAIVFPVTLTFPAGSSSDECLTIFISNDDMEIEGDETIVLVLQNASSANGASIDNPITSTVTIVDNDMAPILAFFNEIHYDNSGGDVGEFIEVAVSDDFAGALSDLVVYLYNGSDGGTYGSTHPLSTFTAGVNAGGFTFYSKEISGIQNGGPDGFALTNDGTLVEFLSYEGDFTATDGPAAGTMSTDIGVSETGSTPAGQSLQRVGNCTTNCPTGLSWTGPITDTQGDINTGQILPVELSYFDAYAADKKVILEWQTAREINNDFMLVERSTDGREFVKIGRVEGSGSTSEEQAYSFTDSSPVKGYNYYRLQQFDFDGTQTTFGPVAVRFNGKPTGGVQHWPVPASDQLNINLPDAERTWTLQVFSLDGRLLLQQVAAEKTSGHTLDIQALPAGSYVLRLIAGDELISSRFIKN